MSIALVGGAGEAAELIEEWILHQRGRGLATRTIDERAAIIRRLHNPLDLTPALVDRFLNQAEWSPGTRGTYHRAIRAWSKWLVLRGIRKDNPTDIATAPKVPKGIPRPVTDQGLAKLLTQASRQRVRDMVVLGAYCGLRVSEIASVRGENVDLEANIITVLGKGAKIREIPLHPLVIAIS